MAKSVMSGVVHKVPTDLRQALVGSPKAADVWNTLTPLGRNEWICWTVSVKKKETREHHISRLVAEVTAGKRRPCCWPGCRHRR